MRGILSKCLYNQVVLTVKIGKDFLVIVYQFYELLYSQLLNNLKKLCWINNGKPHKSLNSIVQLFKETFFFLPFLAHFIVYTYKKLSH